MGRKKRSRRRNGIPPRRSNQTSLKKPQVITKPKPKPKPQSETRTEFRPHIARSFTK